jgi:DNA (cytosine-5)-methyltransferase 1
MCESPYPPLLAERELIKTISFFCGGGGLDLGFAAAGYKVLCSTDKDEFSCRTIQLNAGRRDFVSSHPVVQADITSLSATPLLRKAGVRRSEIQMVIGGPPCQAFSVFGRRKGLADPRGNLVWEYIRLIKEIRPEAFVFENVAGLKTIHGGDLYAQILEALAIDGQYAVSAHSYEMADFGIPQFRSRLFFVGSRSGVVVPPMIPTHGRGSLFALLPYVTAKDALRYLPDPEAKCSVPNHVGRDHSRRITERYRKLKFGERDHVTRINKLNPDKPSFTIIVGSDAGGGKGHVHPHSPREVTPRESARIQTFPDWWEFAGTGRHVIRQVGNAVPPLFAGLLGEHVRSHLFGDQCTRSYGELVGTLGLHFLNNNDSGPVQSQDPLKRC